MLQRLGSDQEWCGWYGHFGPDQYSSSAPLKTTQMVALAGGGGQGCVYHALPLSALSGTAFLTSTLEKSSGERDTQQFPQAIEEYYFLSALMCRPPLRYLNPHLQYEGRPAVLKMQLGFKRSQWWLQILHWKIKDNSSCLSDFSVL